MVGGQSRAPAPGMLADMIRHTFALSIALACALAWGCAGPAAPAGTGEPAPASPASGSTAPPDDTEPPAPGDTESPGPGDTASSTCPAGAPTSGYDGMWQPGDPCERLDQLWAALPGSGRECSSDDDCALVTGPCFDEAVNREAIDSGYSESPCAHPEGGVCPPSGLARAVCTDGCCAPAP